MNNVPKLRFKEFSKEWEEKNYSDIYSFYTTNSFSRDKLNYDFGNVYNIHYGDIHTKFSTMFYLENENVPYINTDVNITKIKDESYCQVGDLVVADASEDYSDIGKTMEIISLNNSQTVAGLHTFLARPNKFNMALGYTGYMLQSWKVRKQVMKIAQGTKVLGIATGRLGKIKLDIPSKQEQQKIASFLTSVDTKIEQLTKKEELLKQYKKAVMQKFFSQEIKFKADDGGKFSGWEEKKLGEITYKISKKNKKNIHYPVYSINNKEGFIPQGQQFEGMNSSDRNYDISLYKIIGEETFAYNPARINVGSLGYSGKLKDIIISSLYVCFKTNNDINDLFLLQYFSTYDFNKSVLRNTEGGVRDYLFYENFSNIKIKIPSYNEQVKIVNFLSLIDSKIAQIHKQLEVTKNFKKGLLKQMFV